MIFPKYSTVCWDSRAEKHFNTAYSIFHPILSKDHILTLEAEICLLEIS
jgi:hypothetical protein